MLSGLTEKRAGELRAQFGLNELSERRESLIERVLQVFSSPTSAMLAAASALSFIGGKTFDGYFIIALLILNIGVSLWHERKTDSALEELKRKLTIQTRVLRDGSWRSIESRFLVPGDIVECGVGSLVPADIKLIAANNLELNEAVLTGESLPKTKKAGNTAFAGSVVSTGLLRGEVVATGSRAYFGKIALAGKKEKRRSLMEQDILSISRYLIISSVCAIAILTAVFFFERVPLSQTLILDLSLLIAGIPISLPTVMTLILSLGALRLAKVNALVRRLAALEDFANVTLLLTDKTGTLTYNKVSVERVYAYAPYDEAALLRFAGLAASANPLTSIDGAIVRRTRNELVRKIGEVLASTPADSVRKRSTTLLSFDGETYLVTLGTPPVVKAFSRMNAETAAAFERDCARAASEGARMVAAALKRSPSGLSDESDMELVGLLVLSDPLRNDARETLAFLKEEGVSTIMVTGDTKETAAHVASALGIHGQTLTARENIEELSAERLLHVAAFAEVLPEDKLSLVEHSEKTFTVAMAGDGVNDLPAVRRADVGMAVESAVDALKGTADIVFLAPGISVMKTALIEARKIFFRLYNYSIYRISESFRIILSALILGILIKGFPLTPIEIILLAFLNDIPILSLAFDRVKRSDRPSELPTRERFALGTLFGLVGVANSVLFYFILASLSVPIAAIQTAFFLKLTVSGHLLIYVTHTRERWWRFLPSSPVIVATVATQLVATLLALLGVFVARISPALILFVWLWAFAWMQVSELMKTHRDGKGKSSGILFTW